jgi:uncharacterized membrane protein
MAGQLHVYVAKYGGADLADDAVRAVQGAGVKPADVAIVEKGHDGTLKIAERKDMGGGKGFAAGAVGTAVLGVLAGPIGWSVLAGGVAGGLIAKFHDAGVPTKRLEEMGEALKPDEALAVVIVNEGDEATTEDVLRNTGGEVLAVAVSDSLKQALETAERAPTPTE